MSVEKLVPNNVDGTWVPDLNEAENYSAARLSPKEMALLWRISLETFKWHKLTNVDFQTALARGKALATYKCASIVLMAAQGQLGNVDPKTGKVTSVGREHQMQLQAAQAFLKQHAPEWMED